MKQVLSLVIIISSQWCLNFPAIALQEENSPEYACITQIISQFNRPFTMIQLGKSQIELSLQAAADYQKGVYVILEDIVTRPDLYNRCLYASLTSKNIIVLNNQVFTLDIERLAECEHFDIVVMLDVQTLGDNWQETVNSIINLGEHIIFSVSTDNYALFNYLIDNQKASLLAQLQHSYIFYIKRIKNKLKRRTWLRPFVCSMEIKSSFEEKKIIKRFSTNKSVIESPWIPGINFLTFKMCGGIIPSSQTLKNSLEKLKFYQHNDWRVHNMIVNGSLELIDFADPRHNLKNISYDKKRERMCSKIATWLDLYDPIKIENYYWDNLYKKTFVKD